MSNFDNPSFSERLLEAAQYVEPVAAPLALVPFGLSSTYQAGKALKPLVEQEFREHPEEFELALRAVPVSPIKEMVMAYDLANFAKPYAEDLVKKAILPSPFDVMDPELLTMAEKGMEIAKSATSAITKSVESIVNVQTDQQRIGATLEKYFPQIDQTHWYTLGRDHAITQAELVEFLSSETASDLSKQEAADLTTVALNFKSFGSLDYFNPGNEISQHEVGKMQN